MKHKYLVGLLFLLPISACVSFASIERNIEEEFAVENGGDLILETARGSVAVSTHNLNTIIVNATLKARTGSEKKAEAWIEDFDISFTQNKNELVIEGGKDRSLGFTRWNNKLQVHYEIIVPEQFNLHLETSGGSFKIKDLEGRVWLDTSGGSIQLDEIVGDVQAHTSGGSISADGVDGNLDISTSGGSLRLNNIQGNVKGKTSGGSIKAVVLQKITEGIDLQTYGGSITLTIPQDLKADIDASTLGGRVSTEIPVLVVNELSQKKLSGSINGGGAAVYLHTLGGNISIKKGV